VSPAMFAPLGAAAYLGAAFLFILSLRGLSAQETARRGNSYGAVGMFIAVVITAAVLMAAIANTPAESSALTLLFGAVIAGAAIGAVLASRVAMTSMPELVAILHSFVGLAAVLVGIANYLEPKAAGSRTGEVELIEIYIGVFIGAVTFTGSIVAFLKLRALIGSKALFLPGRHALNVFLLVASLAIAVPFLTLTPPLGAAHLLVMTGLASILGVHLVMAIGGGDMPVVVSLLNSYSGWAAAAAGFMLSNDLLIITGALVGSSGAILSYIMCKAMNRSLWNVVFAGFGTAAPGAKAASIVPEGRINETTVEQTAQMLLAAKNVIVIPGYGMAVAQAQHPLEQVSSLMAEKGIRVRYAIHPVAGRLPGHMNVLLAEANVSYDIVKEMDEVNEDFGATDIVLIIGANDIVNPSALTDPSSPIYGMPVLEAWKAAKVIMMKRSMSVGYAGVDNGLCYYENTLMLFGDAKKTIVALLAALRSES
jgi:NAD(P) transhydrogenase subunit beta